MQRSLVLLALLTGCGAGWQRPELTPGSFDERQQVQVWHQGKVEQWHGVRQTRDSISGVPFFDPPACDRCRKALARNEVDSIRLGDPPAGFAKSVGALLAITIGIMWYLCRNGCYAD